MPAFLPGLIVARALPVETMLGLLSGQYTLQGGVIRWAAGTAQAGQIVRHLIPVAQPAFSLLPFGGLAALSGLTSTYQIGQMHALTHITQQVFQVANATMVLSGLHLAISGMGFTMLHQRLSALDARLAAIQADVHAIRALLERNERAALCAALADLNAITQMDNPTTRQRVLVTTRQALGPLMHASAEVLTHTTDRMEALAYEAYFCLAAPARARCTAELGELRLAADELATILAIWTPQARRIATDLLIGDAPQRFLYRDSAEAMPVADLVACLDFAYGETQGYGWIDTLRKGGDPWYYLERTDLTTKYRKGTGDPLGKPIKNRRCASDSNREALLRRDRELIIPYLCKLVARRQVLEGYQAQCELLETYQLTPAAFEQKLRDLDIQGDEFVILLAEEYSSV
jgi:hypothetical protein